MDLPTLKSYRPVEWKRAVSSPSRKPAGPAATDGLGHGRGQMISRQAIFLIITCATGASAAAQESDSSIEQISSGSRGAEFRLDVGEQPRSSAPPAQLATGSESSPATPQVTPERRSAPPPDQVSTGGKTAQQPQPLSQPSEGRRAAVDRVEGVDRCDPAEP